MSQRAPCHVSDWPQYQNFQGACVPGNVAGPGHRIHWHVAVSHMDAEETGGLLWVHWSRNLSHCQQGAALSNPWTKVSLTRVCSSVKWEGCTDKTVLGVCDTFFPSTSLWNSFLFSLVVSLSWVAGNDGVYWAHDNSPDGHFRTQDLCVQWCGCRLEGANVGKRKISVALATIKINNKRLCLFK